jgi:outer membrane protein, multidrug efflux system
MLQKIYSKPLIIVLISVVMMAACRVGKEYQRPSLDLPMQFNRVSYADTCSIADIEWKSFFRDSTLQSLIEKGISYNHDLLLAIRRIEISQQRLRQSKLLRIPELNLQVSGLYNNPSTNSLNGLSSNNFLGKSHVETYLATVSLSWEVDIWGKIRRQKEAALAEYLSSYEAAKAVQTQVVASIAQGFFNLLMLDRQLAIARKNLALNDSFSITTRLLKDAGQATALAVQQAEARKLSTALLIPQLQESISLQENALQILTGQLPGELTRNVSLQDFTVLPEATAGVPAAMVSRRPDVRANEMALQIANADVGIAQANMYPALNITAGAGIESFKSANWFNIPSSVFGLVGGTIAQPIFRRRELKTQFEIAKIQREQSVTQFRQSVLRAIGEVSDALVQIEKLKEQEVIAGAQVDTLHGAVFNAQLLFKSDMANYLEVITAQSNSLQEELNLANIRSRQLTATVELYRSLGGGWK